jgi:hypothetical protein
MESDGKRFTDFVLLRCFIDFQTTLVDSRNLVIFSTFWYFFACLFSNCLAKYLVTLSLVHTLGSHVRFTLTCDQALFYK